MTTTADRIIARTKRLMLDRSPATPRLSLEITQLAEAVAEELDRMGHELGKALDREQARGAGPGGKRRR